MNTLLDKEVQSIIDKAREEPLNSYIDGSSGKGIGWRNGLYNSPETIPGPTATALALRFFCEYDFPEELNKDTLLRSLLNSQISIDGKLTGWEVISLRKNEARIPSIDATATVVHVLNSIGTDDNTLNSDKIKAVNYAKLWLLEKLEDGKCGVHENDGNRIFVICNILYCLLPIVDTTNETVDKAIQFLIKAQKESGGWGPTSGNEKNESIYHTSKVLSVIALYQKCRGMKKSDHYTNGIHYLKKQIFTQTKSTDTCYLEESITDCNGNTKTYYHDIYADLLQLIFDNQNEWSSKEIIYIIDKFLEFHSSLEVTNEERPFYYVMDGNANYKKQIWILLPVAIQCKDLKLYLETHRISIVNQIWWKTSWLTDLFAAIIIAFVLIMLGYNTLVSSCIIPFLINWIWLLFQNNILKRR